MKTFSLLASRMSGQSICPFVLELCLFVLLKKLINIELGPQGRGGQGRGRGHLEGGVCEERDEQQVHPQHAQRLKQNFDDSISIQNILGLLVTQICEALW